MKGNLPSIAAKCATGAISATSWTDPEANSTHPVCLAAITSWWSPNIDNAEVARARALTWNTPGSNPPATLYMLGNINNKPWDAVNVVVSAPACNEPWNAPAAPASDCISTTLTFCPNIFFLPCADQSSTASAMFEDGVIGNIAATSVNAYATCAAAVFPSTVFMNLAIMCILLNITPM